MCVCLMYVGVCSLFWDCELVHLCVQSVCISINKSRLLSFLITRLSLNVQAQCDSKTQNHYACTHMTRFDVHAFFSVI